MPDGIYKYLRQKCLASTSDEIESHETNKGICLVISILVIKATCFRIFMKYADGACLSLLCLL
uniref:Uncharacterized protein n=1 Tax=Setaria italica TaxID=4555 RepID=K3XP38_SETIT